MYTSPEQEQTVYDATVLVGEGVAVFVAVGVAVFVGVAVLVFVAVIVTVGEAVFVGVDVIVAMVVEIARSSVSIGVAVLVTVGEKVLDSLPLEEEQPAKATSNTKQTNEKEITLSMNLIYRDLKLKYFSLTYF